MTDAARTGTGDFRPVRVFISYSHDSLEHRRRVWDFAKKLRSDGIDAIIDQYEPYPKEGFPRWMETQIDEADFILVVCTETYLRRVRGKEEAGKGHGARWEGHLIYQDVYDSGVRNEKFIPILFDGEKRAHIPKPLRAFTHYDVDTAEGYEALYRRLSSQPSWLPPKIGPLKTPPLEIETASPHTAEGKTSALWRKLLTSHSLADLERCQARAEALLSEYPDNENVRVVHAQVRLALKSERARELPSVKRHALRWNRQIGGSVVGLIGLSYLLILFRYMHIEGVPLATIIGTAVLTLAGFSSLIQGVFVPVGHLSLLRRVILAVLGTAAVAGGTYQGITHIERLREQKVSDHARVHQPAVNDKRVQVFLHLLGGSGVSYTEQGCRSASSGCIAISGMSEPAVIWFHAHLLLDNQLDYQLAGNPKHIVVWMRTNHNHAKVVMSVVCWAPPRSDGSRLGTEINSEPVELSEEWQEAAFSFRSHDGCEAFPWEPARMNLVIQGSGQTVYVETQAIVLLYERQ